jgi:hypothetical protein
MSSQAERVGADVASVSVRRVRGKLRGSGAEWRWQRIHVRGPHQRWQRGSFRTPGHHGMEEVRGSSPLSSTI